MYGNTELDEYFVLVKEVFVFSRFMKITVKVEAQICCSTRLETISQVFCIATILAYNPCYF